MNQIKIKASIDANNPSQVAAACTFLQSIGAEPAEAPKKTEAKKPEAKKPEAEAEPKITVGSIRALLSTKVNDNRAAIKAKLTELEANNVTSLKEEHYEAFTGFLTALD